MAQRQAKSASEGSVESDLVAMKKSFAIFQDITLPVIDGLVRNGNVATIDTSQNKSVDDAYDKTQKALANLHQLRLSYKASYEKKINPTKPVVIFAMGGPGSGCTTQCSKILQDYAFVYLGVAELLAAEVKRGSQAGDLIAQLLRDGQEIPSELIYRLLKAAMDKSMELGKYFFLVVGFPRARSGNGWESVRALLEKDQAMDIAMLLFFTCPEQVRQDRLVARIKASGGRPNVEAIKDSYRSYLNATTPILSYFSDPVRQKVRKLSSIPEIDEVYKEVELTLSLSLIHI